MGFPFETFVELVLRIADRDEEALEILCSDIANVEALAKAAMSAPLVDMKDRFREAWGHV